MSHCATFTNPSGGVEILRPNPALIAALLLETESDALDRMERIGLTATVVRPLWRAMTARTEEEAVRVIAERDAPRVWALKGYPTPGDLTVRPAIGLLHPTNPRGRRHALRPKGGQVMDDPTVPDRGQRP